MSEGYFITFDGQHGVGKSYIIKSLEDKLTSLGYSVFVTKEPTDTEIGLLARKSEQNFTSKTLACLFTADRHEHCKLIAEKLSCFDIVLCDRYIISALILQNMDGVDFDYIMKLNDEIMLPNLQIVLYADEDLIDERVKGKELSRLARQERLERYNRYQLCEIELNSCVGDIKYMPNNSSHDIDMIFDFILQNLPSEEL